MGRHSGKFFTTSDADHDQHARNCATIFKGAWWYDACYGANLNGLYLAGHHGSYGDGIEWSSWRGNQYSLKFTEMKIRPVY